MKWRIWLAVIVILLSGVVVMAQSNDRVYGTFGARIGTSRFPIYPRGEGNNQHLDFDLDLHIEKGRLTFIFNPQLICGSIIDNPDQFAYKLAVIVRVHPHYFIEMEHTDHYSLNHSPILDPHARRPGSSVNVWWLGPRWVFALGNRGRIASWIHIAFAGDEPVFYAYRTVPYDNRALGTRIEYDIGWHIVGTLNIETFFRNTIDQNRLELLAALERPLARHLTIGGEFVSYINTNVPRSIRDLHGDPLRLQRNGLFFLIKVPFGK